MRNNVFYTTNAVCQSYRLKPDTVNEMVACGIAKPSGCKPEKWLFTHEDFERIGHANKISNELEINMPGAALALQFVEDMKNLHDKEN